MSILLLGAIWIGVTTAFFPSTTEGLTPAAKSGFWSPDFSLQATSGDLYQLEDQRGKVVLINFWTSWCPPCKAEMPTMQKIYNDYKDQDFIILAVNATHEDSYTSVTTFEMQHQLTFPILLDEKGSVTRQYQIHSFPTTFFIDKFGVIDEVIIGGPMAEALLRTRVEELIENAK